MDDRKSLIQKNKTDKGMLQRQSKIIKEMSNYVDCTTIPRLKCEYGKMSCPQCVRKHFERMV